ncbi:hypothetical protein VCHC47A1_0030 [Vibrio cholerae HC-47A1]|nr:hypothetical protein VCHC47A1_0030 [Vibrio cholerae HC-47A1]KKP08850.1 hypothetical protein VP96_03319 [Vibrio cholerae]KKP09493.1 hypothetical protein VS84_03356 [Vibrio cholerae]KKP19145.1 hypothetical protein VS86_03348 [Vibrio cholerae]CQB52069.1 hypothetical protein [Vibrio cholerae]
MSWLILVAALFPVGRLYGQTAKSQGSLTDPDLIEEFS